MNNRITPEISRSDVAPHKEGVLWVECLGGAESHKFTVFSPCVQGVNMHWLAREKRTVPCFQNHDLCPGGHSEKNLKWRCYVHAYSHKRHKQVFVQLTDDAWQSWLHQLREKQNLRGQTIILHRSEKKNGRLWVEVEDWSSDSKRKMPEPLDCKLSLFAMWRFDPSEIMLSANLGSNADFSRNGTFSP